MGGPEVKALGLLCCVFCLTGCFIIRETQPVKMTVIPLPDKPVLTGDVESDLPLLGSHAMELRNLIIRYNEMAEVHNEKAGY